MKYKYGTFTLEIVFNHFEFCYLAHVYFVLVLFDLSFKMVTAQIIYI